MYERLFERVDHLLAVGVGCQQAATVRRASRHMVARLTLRNEETGVETIKHTDVMRVGLAA